MRSVLLLLSVSWAPIPRAEAALRVWWTQDELTGNLIDATGQNPQAVPFGLPQYGQPGVPNGTYGAINVSNAHGTAIGYGPSTTDATFIVGDDNNNPVMNIDASGQLTAMGWIQPAPLELTTSVTYRILSTGSSAGVDRGWGLGVRFTIGTEVVPNARFTAYGVIDKDAPIPLTFGEWIHVAATYDAGVTSLYLNGNFVATHADVRPFGNDSANNRQVIGGRLGGTNNEQAAGLIDGIRVYDTVLTVDEIRVAAAESVSFIPEPGIAALTLFGAALLFRARKHSQVEPVGKARSLLRELSQV